MNTFNHKLKNRSRNRWVLEKQNIFLFLFIICTTFFAFYFTFEQGLFKNNFLFYLSQNKISMPAYYFYTYKNPIFLFLKDSSVHPLYLLPSLIWSQTSYHYTAAFYLLIWILIHFFYIKNFHSLPLPLTIWLISLPLLFSSDITFFFLFLSFLLFRYAENYFRPSVTNNSYSRSTPETFFMLKYENKNLLHLIFFIFSSMTSLPAGALYFILYTATSDADRHFYKINMNYFFISIYLVMLFIIILLFFPDVLSKSTDFNRSMILIPDYYKQVTGNYIVFNSLKEFLDDSGALFLICSLLSIIIVSMIAKRAKPDKKNLIQVAMIIPLFYLSLSNFFLALSTLCFIFLNKLSEKKYRKNYQWMNIFPLNREHLKITAVALVTFLYIILYQPRQQNVWLSNTTTLMISNDDLHQLSVQNNNVHNIELIDLKVIPENVEIIKNSVKLKTIEPIFSNALITYLEAEQKYAANLLSQYEKKDFALVIRSSINPADEQRPFRRIHNIWKTLIETNSSETKRDLFII